MLHMFRLIKEELQEKTVILVTHNTEHLSQLDHIYIMDRSVLSIHYLVNSSTHLLIIII